MLFAWLDRWMHRKVCPECNHDCDRLERAEALHVMSVDAVKTARRKQAHRLSDVQITVEATLRQMGARAKSRAEDRS